MNRKYAAATVGFQIPTSELQNAAKTNPGAIYIPGFNILPGGLPITLTAVSSQPSASPGLPPATSTPPAPPPASGHLLTHQHAP